MFAGEGKPERSWQEITEEASREHDPKKLAELSAELERALDRRDQQMKNDELPASTRNRAS